MKPVSFLEYWVFREAPALFFWAPGEDQVRAQKETLLKLPGEGGCCRREPGSLYVNLRYLYCPFGPKKRLSPCLTKLRGSVCVCVSVCVIRS